MTEDALQKQVAGFLDRVLSPACVWWHTPNGGSRNAIEAAKLKGMGVKPGIADVLIIWPGGAAAIELKTDRGRVSPAQAEMARRFAACGWYVDVCRSLDDVETALSVAGAPVKGRVAA